MHAATMELAHFVVDSRLESVSELARDEAVRALVNWLGCVLGACLEPSIDMALDAHARTTTSAQATLLGRGKRADAGSAAFAAAMSSALFSYGETHPQLRISVSPAVAGAVFALAESRACAGAEVLHAFLLGAETACRIAAASTDSSQRDASAPCGASGAAAACAKLLGLDAAQTARAIGIAAASAAAQCTDPDAAPESWRLGAAACDGLSAALLAQQGASGERIEDRQEIADALATRLTAQASPDRLGTEWQFAASAYHAFPCDASLHTIVEASLQLKAKHAPSARTIEDVAIRLAPARTRRTDIPDPASPAQARRSVQHAAAVALLDGVVGVRQFAHARVVSSRVKQLRARVRVQADSALEDDAGSIAVRLRDGKRLDAHVRCRLGGAQRPLSNDALNAKFRALAAETLATDQAERLLALAWNVAALSDIGALVRASVPEDEPGLAELPGSPLLPR